MQHTQDSHINIAEEMEYLIWDVAGLWRKVFNNETKSLGISSVERRLLFVIWSYAGLTQVQAASYVGLEPQNLTRILDKLEECGWIEKRDDREDRRAKRLYTTEKARSLIEQIHSIGKNVKPDILSGIDDESIARVKSILSIIKSNLINKVETLPSETAK